MTDNTIRVERLKLGLSQGKLAEQLPDDLDAVAIGFIEKGRVLPTRDTMEALCEIFNCIPTDLYAPEDIDLLSGSKPTVDVESAEPQFTDQTPVRQKSGRGHDGMTEFRTWLRPSEKDALEEAVDALGYRNLSEWFREVYRNTVCRYKRLSVPVKGQKQQQ